MLWQQNTHKPAYLINDNRYYDLTYSYMIFHKMFYTLNLTLNNRFPM